MAEPIAKEDVVTTPTVETTKKVEETIDYKKMFEEEQAKSTKYKSRVDELCTEVKTYKEKELANMTQAQKDELARQQREQEIEMTKKQLAEFQKKATLADAGYTKEEIALIMENDTPTTYAKIMADRESALRESMKLSNIKETIHAPQSSDSTIKKFDDYTMEELAQMREKEPAKFKKLLNE